MSSAYFDFGFDSSSPSPIPSDIGSVADYRTPAPTMAGEGYNAGGLVGQYRQAENATHNSVTEDKRSVKVTIKDAHDKVSDGMVFELGMNSNFKHVFEAFKAASCKACRKTEIMRFKTDAKKLTVDDTPKSLNLKHNQTVSIRVFSSGPGLCCGGCQKSGYPTTNGQTFDGNTSQLHRLQPARGQLIRLLFQDPNQKITAVPISSTYQMRHAMGDYARIAECDLGTLHFFFDGEKIVDEDTAEEMSMSNKSLIEVRMHVIGA